MRTARFALTRALVGLAALFASGCATAARSTAPLKTQPSAAEMLSVAERAQQVGDTLRAEQYFLSALARGADERSVLPRLLRLYVQDGQYRSAIDRARDSLRTRGHDVELRLLLATLYRATNLDVSAVEQYELILRDAPTLPRAHLELATLLHDTGQDSARADLHFRTFLQLTPEAPEAGEVRSRLLKDLP